MKNLLTLGEKIWITYTMLYVVAIILFHDIISPIYITLIYLFSYWAIIGMAVLFVKNKKL